METILCSLKRRSLLKLFFILPFVKFLEGLASRLLGADALAAVSETRLKVAKLAQLEKPWSAVRFEYSMKVKAKSTVGESVNEEHLPGLAIRLPDDIAKKKGEGAKAKFQVVNLYCTHNRCKITFVPDPAEIETMLGQKPGGPVFYCGCHQSLFDPAQDAKPILGPAKEPLWKFEFDIKGDDLIVTGINPKAAVWNPGRAGGLSSEYPVRSGERGL